jgi:hypothetical protein
MKVSWHSRGFVARPSYVKVSENGLHTSNFTDLETVGASHNCNSYEAS